MDWAVILQKVHKASGWRVAIIQTGGDNIELYGRCFCNGVKIPTKATSCPLEMDQNLLLLLQRLRQVCTDLPPASATQRRAVIGPTRPVV